MLHTFHQLKAIRSVFSILSDAVKYAAGESSFIAALEANADYVVLKNGIDYKKLLVAENKFVYDIHHDLIQAEIMFQDGIVETARMFVTKDAFLHLRHMTKLDFVDYNEYDSEKHYSWQKLSFGLIQKLKNRSSGAEISFVHVPFSDHKIMFDGAISLLKEKGII